MFWKFFFMLLVVVSAEENLAQPEQEIDTTLRRQNITYKVKTAVYMNITKPMRLDVRKNETIQLIIGLFDEIVPNTTENFRKLCTGELGFGYKGTIFHKSFVSFLIEGGDVKNKDGTTGKSIYKDENGKYGYFKDENYKIEHSAAGFVTMANNGTTDSNGSQFIIIAEPAHWLDRVHVAFGKVLGKEADLIQEMTYLPLDKDHKPVYPIVITACGEYKLKEPVEVISTISTIGGHTEL